MWLFDVVFEHELAETREVNAAAYKRSLGTVVCFGKPPAGGTSVALGVVAAAT